ncbi:hypothetical protein ADK38_04420, partial [Streptomyces varsoviensis]
MPRQQLQYGRTPRLARLLVVRVGGVRHLEPVDGAGAEPGVAAAGRHLAGGRRVRRSAEHGPYLVDRGRAEHHPGAGVGAYGGAQRLQRVELLGHRDRDIGRAPVPQRYVQQVLRLAPAVRRREMAQRARPVHDDPQRPARVRRHRSARLAGPIGG